MNQHFERPKFNFSLQHQRWLFAQVLAEHARLRAQLAYTQKVIEQSREVVGEAWRTIKQANERFP